MTGGLKILLISPRAVPEPLRALGSVVKVESLENSIATLRNRAFDLVILESSLGSSPLLKEVLGETPLLQTPVEDLPDALFLESILEHIPHMIFVKEAQDLRFVRFNRAGERLLGIPRSEMVGRNDFDLFPAEEAEFFQSKDRKVLDQKELEDIPEETIQTREGPRLLHTQKIPICDAGGKPLYLLGISKDITAARAANREAAARLQRARETERRRVAQELHDELGQMLTALSLDLAWLEPKLPTECREHAEGMALLLDRTLATVRRLARRLRPQIVDDLGLVAGLDWLAREICGRRDIDFEVCCEGAPPRLDEEASMAYFRICQEALNNVVRHAEARRVRITLTQDQHHLILRVEDDGVGFPPDQPQDTLGLIGMRERIWVVGGRLQVQSRPGAGTILEARSPLHNCLRS